MSDVPPLEDIIRCVNADQTKFKFFQIKNNGFTKDKNIIYPNEECEKKKQNEQIQETNNKFGGLKKGFLSKKINKKANKNDQLKENSEEIPYIKRNNTKDDLKFPEIKKAMNNFNEIFDQHKERLVSDLEENDDLAKKLLNPKYATAFKDFHNNPPYALEKYKNNTEIQSIFEEFSGIIGQFFTKLADDEGKTKNIENETKQMFLAENQEYMCKELFTKYSTKYLEDKELDCKVEEILKDDEIKQIVLDEDIKNFIKLLKENPNIAMRQFQESKFDFVNKIQKLVQIGILQFSS